MKKISKAFLLIFLLIFISCSNTKKEQNFETDGEYIEIGKEKPKKGFIGSFLGVIGDPHKLIFD